MIVTAAAATLLLLFAPSARELLDAGRYRSALPAAEQAVDEAEERGDEHAVALALVDLADALDSMGHHDAARAAAQRALELNERLFGRSAPETATAALQLGRIETRLGDTETSRALIERALGIRRQAQGSDDPAAAECLHELALARYVEGRYEEALTLSREARDLRERGLGQLHIDFASSLNLEGSILIAERRLEEAAALLRRSLEIKRAVLRPGDPRIGATLNNLALALHVGGAYRDAERFYLEAMEIEKAAYGADHTHVATDANNLGVLYQELGRYDRAEPLLELALRIREARLGSEHARVAETLNNLGVNQRMTGRLVEAEQSYRRAVEIWEATLGPEHPRVAVGLNNLSLAVQDRGGDPTELLHRALAIGEARLGGEHPLVGFSLQHLGRVQLRSGREEQALATLQRSLAIWERALGETHPLIAVGSVSLAEAKQRMDQPDDAERLLRRALEIDEAIFGTEHPRYGELLVVLGRFERRRGNAGAAHELLARGTELVLRARPAVLSLLTERQQLTYLGFHELPVHELVALTADARALDPAAVEVAYARWASWKGSALVAQRELWDVAAAREDPELSAALDELRLARQELARHWLKRPQPDGIEEYRRRTLELEARLGRFEARAVGRLPHASIDAAPIEAQEIAARLPADTALVDYAEIVAAPETDGMPARRIVAFVVGGNEITLADLGDATAIEQTVEHYLRQIEEGATATSERRTARALYRLLLEPLAQRLDGFPQLLISPDGALARLPFEVLQDREGRTVLERFRIAYLPVPRALPEAGRTATAASGHAVVLADPDYEAGGAPERQVAGATPSELTRELAVDRFVRLPATEDEGREVARILETELGLDVRLATGAAASESTLLQVVSPRVLHLSAHGFFLDDPRQPRPAPDSWPGGLAAVDDGLPEAQWSGSLRRSGVALAGANDSLRRGDDAGLVTAEKLLGLDLRGTELAVLSGCETAAGLSRRGEGVFGLQRAFLVAGARSLILSLWPVNDLAARELMVDFYARWTAGASKAEALRRARLQLRRRYPHSRDWGAFILVGAPE